MLATSIMTLVDNEEIDPIEAEHVAIVHEQVFGGAVGGDEDVGACHAFP